LPGFAPETTIPAPPVKAGPEFTVAYAGSLQEAYGIGDLVHAIQNIDNPNIRLDIYGAGGLSKWIQEVGEADPRIRYHGTLPHQELLPKLQQADLLANPRRLDFENVRYSFPSKLLEYLSLGVPTLSTPLPDIPSELAKH